MTARRRTFRRPNKYLAGKFDEWRAVVDDGAVSVFFGTSATWPPHQQQRNETKPDSFEGECEAALARRYVEVDPATGAALVRETEAQRVGASLKKNPFVAFAELRALLLTTAEERLVLEGLIKVLGAIESDIDEHDTPFPTEQDDPPDLGALAAFGRHFQSLLERARRGEPLTPADRAFPG